MANDSFKIKKSINLENKGSSDISAVGDMESVSGDLKYHDGTSAKSVVRDSATQTLTNKTLDNTTTLTIKDVNLVIQDDADTSKQLKLQVSGVSAATTRTLTAPDASTTIVGTDASQTLTNKTIDADSNTITNIENADIKAAAAIAVNKLAALTASRATASDASGFLTASATTSTELGYVSGVTSAIQTQLDGKAASSHTHSAADITSGTLAVARGGTGASSLTANNVILGNGTSAVQFVAPGTSGNVLTSDGSTWASTTPTSSPDQSYELSNLGLAASVAANALTIALKQKSGSDPAAGGGAVKIGTRNSTAATGTYNQRSVTGALSITVSSGSTLGHASAVNEYVWVYAIDNAGTIEQLAVAGSPVFDEGTLQNTTAEGGAGAADSKITLYSTTARTGVAIRLIGKLKSNQSTAGIWATAISEITLAPFVVPYVNRSQITVTTGAGHGSTNTAIRRIETSHTSTGSAITVAHSSTAGTSFTINESGIYAIDYSDEDATSDVSFGISVNSAELTTGIASITAASRLQWIDTSGAGQLAQCHWTGILQAGDVIRPHSNGSPDSTSAGVRFNITKVAN